MSPWQNVIVAIVTSALASSGLWAFVTRYLDKRSASSRMLLGLAHDRIMTLAQKYIERGYITAGEYEDLYKYLYQPYRDMGGNGSAEHIMNMVAKLPPSPHDSAS